MKFLKNKLAVAVIVLSVTFLITIGYSVKREKVSFVEGGIGSILNPVQGLIYNVNDKVKGAVYFVTSFSDIKKENKELREKNDELEKKLLEYDSLKDKYQRLSEMIDLKNPNDDYKKVGCNIIHKSGGSFFDEFVIDRGSNDGIKRKMVVISSKGVIGQVTYTASNWAVVQSLANPNIAISAGKPDVEGVKGYTGIVKGYKDSNNNLLAKLSLLPLDADVKKGDVIVTSGDGGVYPKGYRIGEVIDIEEDNVNLMKNAVIQPYVNYNKLEEVFIIIPKEDREIKY